jgi:hypothetical protein
MNDEKSLAFNSFLTTNNNNKQYILNLDSFKSRFF